MRILCDRHHQGLTQSLLLLFQKRLGWEVYFQQGMEWYPEFWNVYPHPSTAEQYLERELEGLPGVNLEGFKNSKFDVLLCSIPQHIPLFKKLIELYQPQAKLIFQIGNAWSIEAGTVKNVMASARIDYVPLDINFIEYHQEFDLNIFHPEPVRKTKKIYSFINCLNVVDLYQADWRLFLELEKLLPGWEFKSFGGQCRDGGIVGSREITEKIAEADYIYMCKTQGDGYGHNIFNAAAVGRPLVIRKSDYIGKLAEPLIDFDTAITVDNATPETIANIIKESWEDDALTPTMRGLNIYNKFKVNVDFDVEAEKIKQFLQDLQ